MTSFDLSVNGSDSTENTTENTEQEGIDYINFNDEKYTEFIECSDGELVPEIDERLRSGEKYAVACLLNYKLGPKVGESDLHSTIYSFEHDNFPNKAIGQYDGMESPGELDLEKAISPGHYFYRVAGSGEVKKELKEEFHEECEKAGIPQNLEVYKRNFPVRQNADGSEFVTVEEQDDEWENHQIPAEWEEKYDGFPPVLDETPKPEQEPEQESEAPEFDGNIEIPDDEWEECNTDADRMRAIFRNNPGFNALEKSAKVEMLVSKPFEFGKSNVYSTLKGWNSDDESEPETDAEGNVEMTKISQNRFDELLEAEKELEQMKELLN